MNTWEALPGLLWTGLLNMSAFGWVNSILNVLVVVAITWKLFCYAQNKVLSERLGLGLMAGGRMMVLAQIVVNSGKMWRTPTPFDGWSTSVFLAGMLLFFGTRIFIHRWNNWRAPAVMRRSLKDWSGS